MNEARPSQLSLGEVWWSLLQARLRNVPGAAFSAVRGVIQFELGDEHRLTHVVLDEAGVRCGDGFGVAPRAWVESSETALRSLLADDKAPAAALAVTGDVGLVRSLFSALLAAPGPTSLLSLRAGGAR